MFTDRDVQSVRLAAATPTSHLQFIPCQLIEPSDARKRLTPVATQSSHHAFCCLPHDHRQKRSPSIQQEKKGQRAEGKGNGQWAMGNGQWAMGNGQRATGNGQRAKGKQEQNKKTTTQTPGFFEGFREFSAKANGKSLGTRRARQSDREHE
jgi:hypothetical protein